MRRVYLDTVEVWRSSRHGPTIFFNDLQPLFHHLPRSSDRRHNIHVSKSKAGKVPDTIVDLWVRNLPGPKTAIVSLLGAKPDGTSEFSFYSFCGRESFQDWLDKRHGSLSITVREHPTTDYASIPSAELDAIANDVSRLLAEGYTVVLVDSGGETRTSQVCRHMEFVEDTRSL